MVGLCRFERKTQVFQSGGAAVERLFGRGEALRDHRAAMLRNDIFLGLEEVRKALDPESFSSRRRDEQDVRHGRHGVGPLDIERYFDCPGTTVLLPGAIRRGGRGISGRVPLLKLTKGRRPSRAAGEPFFPAHVRKTECIVEDLQIVANGFTAKGVDDDNRLPLALVPCLDERRQIVGGSLGKGVETSAADGVAQA